MRLADVVKGLGISLPNGAGDVDIKDIVTHTSRVREGSLFVCLIGKKYDGHAFISAAKALGAVAFLVKRGTPKLEGFLMIESDNIPEILPIMLLRVYNYGKNDMFCIGITGTKGKSTTAEFLSYLLTSSGHSNLLIGTLGVRRPSGERIPTENTTPPIDVLYKELAEAHKYGAKYAVIELSSQALASDRCGGIKFSLGIFTGISEDHIGDGEHENFNEYYLSKKRLFTDFGVEVAVVNSDCPLASDISSAASRTVTVGHESGADYLIKNVRSELLYTEFLLGGITVRLSVGGSFNALNASMALAAAAEITGRDISSMTSRLSDVHPEGRFDVYSLSGRYFIIDFAHNAESFRAVLSDVKEKCRGRLIVLFGSVGGRCYERRAAIAAIAESYADISVITSDDPGEEDASIVCEDILLNFVDKERAAIIPDRAEAIRYAYDISLEGDVVMLLGKGHERYQTSAFGRVPFSERDILLSMGAVHISDKSAPDIHNIENHGKT